MRDLPIIFSAPMVRALLDGRKTMTRRLAWKPLVIAIATEGRPVDEVRDPSPWQRVQPGDRLWVREAFRIVPRTAYARSEGVQQALKPDDTHDAAIFREGWDRCGGGPWRPSIHMPRWASRLTLTVTAVKVERLQDISEADARAEGVLYVPGHGEIEPSDLTQGYANFVDSRMGFEILWNSLHGPDAWASNPEVVALTFTVEKGNIDG